MAHWNFLTTISTLRPVKYVSTRGEAPPLDFRVLLAGRETPSQSYQIRVTSR